MIKPSDKTQFIIDAFSPVEWEQIDAADLKSGKKGRRVPKEFKREFISPTQSPVAARWKRNECARDKRAAEKAAHDAKPSVLRQKRAERVRALYREGAKIAEIVAVTGLAARTVMTHTADIRRHRLQSSTAHSGRGAKP